MAEAPSFYQKIEGIPFYSSFYPNEQGRGLQNSFSPEQIRASFLFATDWPRAKNGSKLFALFPDCYQFYEWFRQVHPDNRTFYETIMDGPQKFRFDIEYGIKDDETFSDKLDIVTKSMITAIHVASHFLRLTDFDKDVLIISSHGPKKISYHVIFNNCYLPNATTVRLFFRLIHDYMPAEQVVYLDPKVYSTLQQFRMLWNHKISSERVLQVVDEWEYNGRRIKHQPKYPNNPASVFFESLITLIDKDLPLFNLNIHNYLKTTEPKKPLPSCTPTEFGAYCMAKMKYSMNGLDDPASTEIVSRALKALDPYIIDEYGAPCLKFREVQGNLLLFDRIKPSRCFICERVHEHENYYAMIVGKSQTLYLKCRRDMRGGRKFVQCLNPYIPDFTIPQAVAIPSPVPDEVYHEPQVRPFNDLQIPFCFMLQSHMGTGKTTATFGYIKANQPKLKRILLITCRRIFATNIVKEVAAKYGLHFTCYLDVNENLDKIDWLAIQIESIWKLMENENLEMYDLVVMDEISSILFQFSSPTMRSKLARCVYVFEYLISFCPRIIALDAFLNVSGVECMKYLRSVNDDVIVHRNTYNPIKRTAYQYQYKHNFTEDIIDDAIREIPVYMASSSKTLVSDMEGYLKKSHPNMAVKCYSEASDDKTCNEDLQNCNEAWSDLTLILATTKITVGVSFEKKHYKRIYLYSSCMGPIVRDIMQSSRRIRDVEYNEVRFHLFTKYFRDNVNDLTIDPVVIRQNIINKGQIAELITKQLGMTQCWYTIPDWILNVMVHNELEKNLSALHHEEVFKHYCEFVGYNIVPKEDLKPSLNNIKIIAGSSDIFYDKIMDISNDLADTIMMKKEKGMATKMEKLELDKHIFKKFIDLAYSDIDKIKLSDIYHELWCNPESRQHLYNLRHEKRDNFVLTQKNEMGLIPFKECAENSVARLMMIKRSNVLLGIPNSITPVEVTCEFLESPEARKFYNEVREIASTIFGFTMIDTPNQYFSTKITKLLHKMYKSWNGCVFQPRKKDGYRLCADGHSKKNISNRILKQDSKIIDVFKIIKR